MPSPPLSILQSLSPRIAVLTSEDVVRSSQENGCAGLHELLRPWEGGTERVSILSTTLTPTVHPTFPVRFVSYDTVYTNPARSAPSPDVLVDIISSVVGARKPGKQVIDFRVISLPLVEDEQHYPLTRSLLLSSRPVAPYETFNHPVGVLFAISTSTPDPLGTLNKLHARTIGPSAQSLPWLDGHTVLRFYVVVHDVSQMGDNMTPANELLASVKRAYGPHSTLLVINSQVDRRPVPPSPDTSTHPAIILPRAFIPEDANPSALSQVYASALSSLTLSPMSATSPLMKDDNGELNGSEKSKKLYGSRLTAEDTQRLTALVRELVVQSLVPWMEARVREWNEIYHNNRRGITGRLFGAGRKFFGSRPNSPATDAVGYNASAGYYSLAAVEALSRRLADFEFMLRDYRSAANIYDSLRRDFAQDRAWRYASAATEMYGLSLLLAHSFFSPSIPPTTKPTPFTNLQHTEITSWLEQAVISYHQSGPASQIQIDALRITVLYYEAWKAIREWRGVGAALVKGAGEADEVPSAVLIEEAAVADIKGGKSGKGKRRSAFHLILAARRYETAGLKKYSRRCLDRASQIYRSAPWTAAQDRIEYSLGRQAYTLGECDTAVEHFLRLLKRENTGVPGSQAGPLQDMALAYEQLCAHPELLESSKSRLQLPTPVFDVKKTRIITSSSSSFESGPSRENWVQLEEQALRSWDRKGKKPVNLLPDEKINVVGTDESFTVELVATNPINAPLFLSDITLTFNPSDSVTVSPVYEITLDPYETRAICVNIIANDAPSTNSVIRLLEVSFKFHKFFPCTQSLERKGRRLQATKAQRLAPTYAADTSLSLSIIAERPRLDVDLVGIPDKMFAGEEVEGVIRVKNIGRKVVRDLKMIWTKEVLIRRKENSDESSTMTIPNRIESNKPSILLPEEIPVGATRDIAVILNGFKQGQTTLFGLITFESVDDGKVATTLVKNRINVQPLMTFKTTIRPVGTSAKEFALVLEVMNVSTTEVRVDGIHGVSLLWSVEAQEAVGLFAPSSKSNKESQLLIYPKQLLLRL
ncbi:hypothetical protein I309_02978 [Cryptococcus deuterogattii LA55]|nr:hypothetical protein I309_02978 [Cryptococcus deuterogattii LA55]KIR90809.1 hypothetical protein I304_05461 [Cryptococcus deuterogattii CBS 10090]